MKITKSDANRLQDKDNETIMKSEKSKVENKMKKYETVVRVPFVDTDRMGIVYHANYIKYFEIGRTEYLRDIGFPYVDLEMRGIWLPVGSVHCTYKSPAKYDDLLTVRTHVAQLKGATIVMAYEIHRKETEEVLATGETVHPITDDRLRPIRLRNVYEELYNRIKEDL